MSIDSRLLHYSGAFRTTRWSLVRSVKEGNEVASLLALEQLCNCYWHPIYAFLRRSGQSPHDAEDLTQGFFAKLLDKATLANADPSKGKLRTFLLTCVRRFAGDEQEKAMAHKRGAKFLVSFTSEQAEERYTVEPVDDVMPDRLYQRRWALTILEYSLQGLADEHEAQGKAELFRALRPFLGFQSIAAQNYENAAATLKIPVGTLKNHVSRLRQRWREILFQQVSVTLEDPTPENIKGELAELLACV